jgi:hypothetical protein
MYRDPPGSYQNFHLGSGQPADEDFDPSVREFSVAEIANARKAVSLVMHDVVAQLGDGAVAVVVGTKEELHEALTSRGLGWIRHSEVCGWVHGNDGSGTGIWFPVDVQWPDLVVLIAGVIQEGIIEGAERWGVAFPICPTHPNHPMDAEVVEGVACWVCPRKQGDPLPIGSMETIS